MRIKKDIFLSWRYNWQQELKMHGSIHALQSKFPAFAYEDRRNMILFATGSQIRYEKMDCRSTNPVCTEQMWRAWGGECVWCAQNGSAGFAVNRRYSAQRCVEGVLVRGVCPPQVNKVSRSGDAYLVEGTHFDNYLRVGPNNFTDLAITACGDACLFGKDNMTETRISCTVNGQGLCHDVVLRGTLKNALENDQRDTLTESIQQTSLLLRNLSELAPETVPRNGQLTLHYRMEDTTTPYRTAKIAVFAASIFVLLTMLAVTAYIKRRQYLRRLEWEIPYKKVKVEERIGNGQYGVVFRAYYYGPVAVKQLDNPQAAVADIRTFENEIRLLKSLHHTNVLSLLGVVRKPRLAIVTDWCYCSLFWLIHQSGAVFEPATIVHFCRQIAEGMNYLHSKGVTHRDLKSSNILLAEATGSTLKICDFGLSTVNKANQLRVSPNNVYGTVRWMAPEILSPNGSASVYTVLSDVFAYGVCVYELLTSKLPYAQYEDQQVACMIPRGLLRLDTDEIDSSVCPTLSQMMQRCVSFDPNQRPTFDEICADFNRDEGHLDGKVPRDVDGQSATYNGRVYESLPQSLEDGAV